MILLYSRQQQEPVAKPANLFSALSSRMPKSLPKTARQVETDVINWGDTMKRNLPDPDTAAYEELIYFDLEAIRNGGLASFQFMPESVWHLRTAVETITDLLTSLRYGKGERLQYVRTAYVPGRPMEPTGYPQYVIDDCLGALDKLEKQAELFERNATDGCLRVYTDFKRVLQVMVGEFRKTNQVLDSLD